MEALHAAETTKKLLQYLNVEFTDVTSTKEEGNILRVEITAPVPSKIIGWHGETLNSLQHLLKSFLRATEHESAPFLVLDIDNYRRDQEQKVCRIAAGKADFVRNSGHRIALPPMSAYFRRIVHLYIANDPSLQDLTTESVGKGEYRQIILRKKIEDRKPSRGEELTPILATDDGLENLDI